MPSGIDFLDRAAQSGIAFGRVFSTVDRVLNPDVIGVRVVGYNPYDGQYQPSAPGWSDGENIYLNQSYLPPLYQRKPKTAQVQVLTMEEAQAQSSMRRDNLSVWMGVNAHELGHTLYTPRNDSVLVERIKQLLGPYPRLFRVFNLLEDQRQERLLLAEFPTMRSHLLSATAFYFYPAAFGYPSKGATGNPMAASDGGQWPLVAGRTWIDPAVRKRIALEYAVNGGDYRQVARLIGEYQRIGDPGLNDADHAFEVILEVHKLLLDDLPEVPQGCGGLAPETQPQRRGWNEPKSMTKGEDTPAVADEELVPVADGEEWDDEGFEDEIEQAKEDFEKQKNEGKGEGEDQPGDGDKGEDGDGDPNGGDGTDDGDTRVPPIDDRYAPSHSGASGEDGSENINDGLDDWYNDDEIPEDPWADNTKAQDLANQIKDQAMRDLSLDKTAQKDMKSVMAALADPGVNRDEVTKDREPVPVSDVSKRTAKKMSERFRQFVDRSLPYWERRVDSGRLNVDRYMNSDSFNYDELFDRFDPGNQDDMSLEVVVLLDRSGSMGHGPGSNLWKACEASWVVCRAVTEADGEVAVIAYDTASYLIAAPGEKVNPNKMDAIRSGGGTNPTKALIDAFIRLEPSEAAHKVCVFLTDGDWAGGEDVVRAINNEGITTIGFVIGGQAIFRRQGQENATLEELMGTQYAAEINDPFEMLPVIEKVIVDRLEAVGHEQEGWAH